MGSKISKASKKRMNSMRTAKPIHIPHTVSLNISTYLDDKTAIQMLIYFEGKYVRIRGKDRPKYVIKKWIKASTCIPNYCKVLRIFDVEYLNDLSLDNKFIRFKNNFNDQLLFGGSSTLAFFREVIEIEFGYHFNQQVDGYLPASLQRLTFGHCFNQPTNKLPSALKNLKFGQQFQQPVVNLPDLDHLEFERNYSRSLDELPMSLKQSKLESNYTGVIRFSRK
jgi:hypothetical protein